MKCAGAKYITNIDLDVLVSLTYFTDMHEAYTSSQENNANSYFPPVYQPGAPCAPKPIDPSMPSAALPPCQPSSKAEAIQQKRLWGHISTENASRCASGNLISGYHSAHFIQAETVYGVNYMYVHQHQHQHPAPSNHNHQHPPPTVILVHNMLPRPCINGFGIELTTFHT